MYNYRSPLQDYEFYQDNRHHDWGHWAGPPRLLPRFPPPSRHRLGPHPYFRPSTGVQVPRYSSRYQLSSYPKELNDMFGALECKLCSVEAQSPIGAKMHYSGKPHMKKVKQFLTEWSLKTGNPMPNFEEHASKASVSSLADYCELCDVRLFTSNDKMLHYTGKHHRKNERDPANAKKKGKTYETFDLSATDSRFGIGISFTADSKELDVSGEVKISDFVCEMCNVKAASQDQLNIHLTGKKHMDKLKKKESGVPKAVRPYKCNVCNISFDTPYSYSLHIQGKPHAKAMKKIEEEFKGASCNLCGVNFNSYNDFEKHTNGKKHEKKRRQYALRTPVPVKDQKETITCKNCQHIGDSDNHECDKSLQNLSVVMEIPDNKWKCIACYNVKFESEEEFKRHKKSRRHLLCMLNVEGDKITEGLIHYYCFTCRKQCLDTKDYCAHLFSEKHMTLSDETCDIGSKTDLWHCCVCSIVMDQEVKEKHQRSKSHLLQAAQQDITKELTNLATQDLGTNTFHCTHCDLTFVHFVAFYEHMLDIQHLEGIIQTKIMASGLKIE